MFMHEVKFGSLLTWTRLNLDTPKFKVTQCLVSIYFLSIDSFFLYNVVYRDLLCCKRNLKRIFAIILS